MWCRFGMDVIWLILVIVGFVAALFGWLLVAEYRLVVGWVMLFGRLEVL